MVFGTQNFLRTQLQTLAENFLEVERPYIGYAAVSSDHELSNALTLMSIRQLESCQTTFVKSEKSTVKKRPPLKSTVTYFLIKVYY